MAKSAKAPEQWPDWLPASLRIEAAYGTSIAEDIRSLAEAACPWTSRLTDDEIDRFAGEIAAFAGRCENGDWDHLVWLIDFLGPEGNLPWWEVDVTEIQADVSALADRIEARLIAIGCKHAALRSDLATPRTVASKPGKTVGVGPILLTVEQAADALAVSRSTVHKLIKAGELQSRLVGSSRRVAVGDLERYVAGLGEQG